MKKWIVLLLSIMTTCLLLGCAHTPPGAAETQAKVDDLVGGENVTLQGEVVTCLDRDMKFRVYWEESEDSVFGVKYKSGVFQFYTDYNEKTHAFWNEEYHKAIDKYQFALVDYGMSKGPECHPSVVRIYIESEAPEKERHKVEGLLRDLRDICIMEDAYHTNNSYLFYYNVHLYYSDSVSGNFLGTGKTTITKDSTDDELKLDNIAPDPSTSPRNDTIPMSNGNALIMVE